MQLLERHPFWGYLLLQVQLVPVPDLPALAATDGIHRIWYNPHFTRQLTEAELGFVIAHELVHQLFSTVPRRLGRDPVLWSIATDYVVNRMVQEMAAPANYYTRPMYEPVDKEIEGLGLVSTLLEPKYDRLIAEAIYDRLLRKPSKVGALVQVDLPTEIPDADDSDDSQEPVEDPEEESGVSLRFRDVPNHSGGFDLHLPVPLDDDQREELRDRVAAALEHHQMSGERGTIPGDWLRETGLLTAPVVPWQRLLARYLDEVLSKDEYSRSRPNKRHLIEDVVIPGLSAERVESIAIAIDTSGSIDEELLISSAREVLGLIPHAEEVVIIVADAEVQDVTDADGFEPMVRQYGLRGGGGTDHRPVFDYLTEQGITPNLFIGFTDLYSAFPERAPACPVLWMVPTTHGAAPWGDVIVLPD